MDADKDAHQVSSHIICFFLLFKIFRDIAIACFCSSYRKIRGKSSSKTKFFNLKWMHHMFM